MDEDSDSAKWVLVDEVDCAEEAITLNSSAPTAAASLDSDQESDGSISIISDHPNDSYSEEEIEAPSPKTSKKNNYFLPKITPIIKIDTEFESNDDYDDIDEGIENEIQKLEAMEVPETARVEDLSEKGTITGNANSEFEQAQKLAAIKNKEENKKLKTEMEDVAQKVTSSHQASVDDVSSTSELSNGKQWTFVNEKLTLEKSTDKKTFFLDCSQEPILEVSAATDTDVDTESTTSFVENQAVVRQNETPARTMPNRDASREQREFNLNHISIGFLLSIVILASSHLIGQYLDYNEDSIQSPIYSSSFLESIMDNEGGRPIVDFCVDRQKAKEGEYSERAVEKCVTRRLRKKNKEDEMKKTEIYLQMKERVLELREKELAEKERQILQKWRKRAFDDTGKEKNRKKYEKKADNSKEENFKTSKKWDHKDTKYQDDDFLKEKSSKIDDIKGKIKTFRKKSTWVFESAKEANNGNYKTHSKEDLENTKRSKKAAKAMEETLRTIKDQAKNIHKEKFKIKEETMKKIKNHVKAYQKDRSIRKLRNKRNNKKEQNEEWYIKYNPIKNTIELINITTLPEQDSLLIRNGNKTINGQWYFSLYGSGRSSIRSREKAAEWYFRRGHLRENKRDKAKWYFDYMSARDNTRYFY